MSSREVVHRTSLTSVIIPRIFIAVRRNVADRLVLVNEFRVVKRHSSMEVETSGNVPDVLRLWNALKTVADGEWFIGETGMSHCRRLVAAWSMLSNAPDVSFDSPGAENMELATP